MGGQRQRDSVDMNREIPFCPIREHTANFNYGSYNRKPPVTRERRPGILARRSSSAPGSIKGQRDEEGGNQFR